MTQKHETAAAEFRRIMKWIAFVAVLAVIAAIVFLAIAGDLTVTMVIATILGVFFSVLLGCGLFAAAFFSNKSGHDQAVTDATQRGREQDRQDRG